VQIVRGLALVKSFRRLFAVVI